MLSLVSANGARPNFSRLSIEGTNFYDSLPKDLSCPTVNLDVGSTYNRMSQSAY